MIDTAFLYKLSILILTTILQCEQNYPISQMGKLWYQVPNLISV